MTIQSIRMTRDNELLVSANNQLEQLYGQQHDPCLALHISRNYRLLQEQNSNSKHQKLWQEKAKLWWKLYRIRRLNKMPVFYIDENIIFS